MSQYQILSNCYEWIAGLYSVYLCNQSVDGVFSKLKEYFTCHLANDSSVELFDTLFCGDSLR